MYKAIFDSELYKACGSYTTRARATSRPFGHSTSALMDYDPQQRPVMNRVLERNIDALLARQQRDARERTRQERLAAAITRFTGSLYFVYLHLAAVLAWVLINAGWTPLPQFDPTFVLLATIASVEAIFLTSFVLMTQNRMQAEADRRADLDLQISLLTEHELTRLVKLIGEVAERMGIAQAADPELQEIKRDIAPENVLDQLDAKKRQYEGR
jgi:uncharacterized membrane protein